MPRARTLGFRKTRTLRPDTSEYFARLQRTTLNNAIISRIPATESDAIKKWSKSALRSHLAYRKNVWNKYVQGVFPPEWDHIGAHEGVKKPKSPNDGQIVLIKDNFVTKGLPTTCASDILRGFQAEESCRVVEILEEHGMKVVGKTNMDEFGMGSHSTYSAFGPVSNGIDRRKQSVGGSSGGSAYAVAAKLAHIAIGSDTGGSVRLPAAYTATVGFKPSYGRISRRGLVPYANSLDTVGIIGKDMLDVWLLFKILDMHDHLDPTSLNEKSRGRIQRILTERFWLNSKPEEGSEAPIRITTRPTMPPNYAYTRREFRINGMHGGQKQIWNTARARHDRRRIGVPAEYNIEELHPAVRQAWARALSALSNQGHDIVPISLPHTKEALAAYYVLAPAEASSNLAKYDGVRYGKARYEDSSHDDFSKASDSNIGENVLYAHHRGMNFGPEVKRRILLGTFSLSADSMSNYFIQAQKIRRLVQEDFNMVFRMRHPLIEGSSHVSNGVDYILCPTAPTPPPLFSELEQMDQFDSYINDVFTVPASLAGLPALSIPAIYDEDLPTTPDRNIGLQLIGQFGDDYSVLNFARRFLDQIMNRNTVDNILAPKGIWTGREIR